MLARLKFPESLAAEYDIDKRNHDRNNIYTIAYIRWQALVQREIVCKFRGSSVPIDPELH